MSSPVKKRALITGITGQDGAFLTELLLRKDYEVHGLLRRSSSFNTDRIDHLYHDLHIPGAQLTLHYGDLADGTALRRVLEKVQPQEVYNLGAQSHVKVSFEVPEYTADIVAIGTLRLLEALRDHTDQTGMPARYYQAGSSEMFGATPPPQNELTPFYPRSPYAASKVAAHWYAVNYREAHGMFIANGILVNHESPRRGETVVTRKITRAVGRIREGLAGIRPAGLQPCWARLAEIRRDRSALLPADRGQFPPGRPQQGARALGLAPAGRFCDAGKDDG